MKILVTGANGFIGSALIKYFSNMPEIKVVGMVRRLDHVSSDNIEFRVWDMCCPNKTHLDLSDIDVIIHTAGRTHKRNSSSDVFLREFRRVNTDATLDLAKLAAASKVKRFVFLSSIKASVGNSNVRMPFSKKNMGKLTDENGISKYKAEIGLMKISNASGLEVTIVRPPIVYGPGVKGNFNTLIKILSMRFPLPLGSVTNNRRSMIGIDNLMSFLGVCVNHPNAANNLFFVSDNNDLSTFQLLTLLGKALNKPALLIKFPVPFLVLIAKLIGAKHIAKRITGSLRVDISMTLKELNWTPPFSVEKSLQKLKRNDKSDHN